MLKHLSFFYKNMQIIHSYIQHIIRIAAIILSIMVVSSCNLSLWQEKNEDDKIKIERYDRLQARYLTTGDFSALQSMNTSYPMETRTLIENKIGRAHV